MTSFLDDLDMTDPRNLAAWGEPEVTPDRVDAWDRWVLDYAVSCANRWIEDGASVDDAKEGAAAILCDFSRIESEPWMPLGPALAEKLGSFFMSGKVADEHRVRFMSAMRTYTTASRSDMVLAVANNLGMSVQRAEALAREADRQNEEPAPTPGAVALYRHFDATGVLLYVGITNDVALRADQHSKSSPWWRFSARLAIEWHDTRSEAALAERDAIRRERPVFNDSLNRANRSAAIEYLMARLDEVANA